MAGVSTIQRSDSATASWLKGERSIPSGRIPPGPNIRLATVMRARSIQNATIRAPSRLVIRVPIVGGS